MLDTLAPNDTRRLEKEIFVGINIQVRTKRGTIVVRRCRRMVKIHHIWDNGAGKSFSTRELSSGKRVDNNMLDGWQTRRKGHLEIITDAINEKPFTLPRKIMMVTD